MKLPPCSVLLVSPKFYDLFDVPEIAQLIFSPPFTKLNRITREAVCHVVLIPLYATAAPRDARAGGSLDIDLGYEFHFPPRRNSRPNPSATA
jgi:hypothetical protein